MYSQHIRSIARALQPHSNLSPRIVPITFATLALALAFGSMSTAAAQTRLDGTGSPSADGSMPSILPGSPAIEGEPFVVDLHGAPSARALVALTGDHADAALRESPVVGGHLLPNGKILVELDGYGNGRIVMRGWQAGSELTLRAVIEDSHGGSSATTQSLSVRPLPPRGEASRSSGSSSASMSIGSTSQSHVGGMHFPAFRSPVITTTQVIPAVANVGAQVVIAGPDISLFNGYAPKDVHLISPAITGCLGKVNSINGSSINATITAGSPFPAAAPLKLQGGQGVFTNVPPFGGMSYGQPVWGWQSLPGAPELDTGTSFKTNAQSVFQPCGDPAMFVEVRFRLEDGKLKVKLPGMKACKGDTFVIEPSFRISDGTTSTGVAVSVSTTSGLAAAAGWFFDSLFPLFPLTLALASPSGCTTMYNSPTNEIWIMAPSGKTITQFDPASFLRINFDPNEHVIVTETHGVDDNYSTQNGAELTTPSAAFEAYVLTTYSIPARREYDNAICDRYLRDTFSGYGPGTHGMVRSGNVQMHINGFSCQTDTDAIILGWTPTPAFDWVVGMPKLAILNFQWSPGDDATLCFDIAQLPVMSASNQVIELRNIVERVDENHLDVGVEDDTTVDYITLKVLRCKTP